MTQAIGRVRVADFDRFVQTFKSRGKELRGKHGSRGATVYRNADQPNEAIIVFEWDKAEAQAFFADPKAREVLNEAGVQGTPEMTYVEQVVKTEA